MAIFQNLVQFAPTPGLGQPMKGIQPATFSVRINPDSEATGIQVATPLTLFADGSTAEIVTDVAGPLDRIFGVIPANTKKNTYSAGDVVEMFGEGNTLLLEATAAIDAASYLAIGNSSAAGGGPGVTATTTPGVQYGGIALTTTTAGAKVILVLIKAGLVPSITAWAPGTVAVTAGAATVANTAVTANSQVLLTLKTPGGTIASAIYVATITPGTGFTLAGGGGSNTSTYNYVILN